MGKSKHYSKCSECGRNTKSTIIGKKGFVCKECSNKYKTMIRVDRKSLQPKITLEDAMEKTYEIKGYKNTKGRISCVIHTPQILIGKRVKFILAEDSP